MIENSMVLGDYYADSYDEDQPCEHCVNEAEYRLSDGTWLCDDCFDEYSKGSLTLNISKTNCPCIFCHTNCGETCDDPEEAA